MRIIKLETFAGNNISTVTKEAKEQAIKENATVEFDFNGILCRVSEQTNIDLLLRDYGNSFLMGWKTIGTVCVDEYSSELLAEMKIKREEQEEKSRLQTEAYRKKEAEEKEVFQKLIEGVEFKIKDQKKYDEWKAKNTDGYGACIFEYAEGWGRMLQTKLPTDDLDLLMEDFNLQPNYLGITGFQHGAAKQILNECWFHSTELEVMNN